MAERKNFKIKPEKKIGDRKGGMKGQPKDVRRAWTLAKRLRYRRIK